MQANKSKSMKSTSIKYAFLALCAAFALTGCRQEAFDEMTELPLTRCLVPMELSASVADGDQVTFSWKVTKDAQRYQLELSEDAAFTAPEAIVVPSAEVPKTIQLTVDKTYFWRVKALNDNLEPSKWALPATASFDTYPVRKSLNPVVVSRETNAISIAWDDAADKADLNSIEVVPLVAGETDTPKLITLEAADVTACTKKIEGLDAGREYKFTLLFGKAGVRGVLTACTRPDMGAVVAVSTSAGLLSAADKTGAPARVKLAYSADPVEMAYADPAAEYITVNADLYLYGESAEDGKKPALKNATFKIKSGATVVHLEDLALDAVGINSLLENVDATVTAIEIVNCEVTGYTNGIITVAESAAQANTAKFLVDGCYMHDFNAAKASVGADFIDFRHGANGEIIVRNSTFYNCARSFVRVTNNAKIASVLLENNTFNYVTATPSSSNNRGIISVSRTAEPTSIIVRKNVFLNMYSEAEAGKAPKECWVRLCRSSDDSYRPACSGNVYFRVGDGFMYSTARDLADKETTVSNGDAFKPVALTEAVELTDDPCVKSEAGKLYLQGKGGAAIVKAQAGDPRWWNAVQPEVIRATELTVVTGDYTWDFTEKTIYDTETLNVPTIIGNARIFALPSVPAQVTMSEGVTFSQGAVLSGGVPQYSGVGILTTGTGSVKVTAVGTDATAEVVAGGDRYPVLADGVEHTVVLGDLIGENNIYVIADKELTLKKITWTTDLTPEETKKPLAKPSVSIAPNKVELGSEEDVVVSWEAVPNAADYVYTYQGAESITAETSFTIPGADVALLAEGEYVVTVKARPVSTSTKWLESAVASASMKVEKSGTEVKLSWDFSASAWTSKFAQVFTAKNNNETPATFTVDELSVVAGGGTIKYNDYEGKTFIQTGGAGTKTKRCFQFTAPAGGTLTAYVTNTNDDDKSDRLVGVTAGSAADVSKKGGFPKKDGPVAVEFEISEAGSVAIYSLGSGLCFYGFEFTYTAPGVELDWDFSATAWTDKFAAAFTAKNNNETPATFTVDELSVVAGGGTIKYNDYEGKTFIQTGGAGSKTKRCFQFTAPAAGTLTAYVTNTNDDDKSDRLVGVTAGSAAEVSKKGGFPKKDGPVAVEFEISEAGSVAIYSLGSGLCFYGFHFKGN